MKKTITLPSEPNESGVVATRLVGSLASGQLSSQILKGAKEP